VCNYLTHIWTEQVVRHPIVWNRVRRDVSFNKSIWIQLEIRWRDSLIVLNQNRCIRLAVAMASRLSTEDAGPSGS
jgi:hypothetical protein